MDIRQYANRIVSRWTKFPEQVKRLSVLLIILVVLFVPVRQLLIPDDFGKVGHYRASALDESASLETRYAGREACVECHDDVVQTNTRGYHRSLACEVCHGPASDHVNDPAEFQLRAPRERGYCPLCHEYLASRPTGFPQIVSASHNPMKPCISCHDPHDPVPPQTPKECEACHAAIARTKAVSHHVYVPCTRCHDTPQQHRVSPREYRPSKPMAREFCGSCHAQDAQGARDIRRVDMATHGERYVCWQCHYPHLPEGE